MQVRVAIKPDRCIQERWDWPGALPQVQKKGTEGTVKRKGWNGDSASGKGASRTSSVSGTSLSAACTHYPDDLQCFCSKPICWTQRVEDREEKEKKSPYIYFSDCKASKEAKSLNIYMMKCCKEMSKQKVGTREWSVPMLLAHTSSCLVHVEHTNI